MFKLVFYLNYLFIILFFKYTKRLMNSALKKLLFVALSLFAIFDFSYAQDKYKIGQVVDHFSMFDFNSVKHATKDLEDKNILVIYFISNNCPQNNLIIPSIMELEKNNSDEVGVWAVNSFNPNFNPMESEEEMRAFSEKNDFKIPYLVDLGQIHAGMFDVTQVPTAVILKKIEANKFKFVYKGPIIANNTNYVNLNVQNIKKGKAIQTSSNTNKGCKID